MWSENSWNAVISYSNESARRFQITSRHFQGHITLCYRRSVCDIHWDIIGWRLQYCSGKIHLSTNCCRQRRQTIALTIHTSNNLTCEGDTANVQKNGLDIYQTVALSICTFWNAKLWNFNSLPYDMAPMAYECVRASTNYYYYVFVWAAVDTRNILIVSGLGWEMGLQSVRRELNEKNIIIRQLVGFLIGLLFVFYVFTSTSSWCRFMSHFCVCCSAILRMTTLIGDRITGLRNNNIARNFWSLGFLVLLHYYFVYLV